MAIGPLGDDFSPREKVKAARIFRREEEAEMKKGKRGGSRFNARLDESDDDTLSTTSTGASASSELTANNNEVENERDEESVLDDLVDSLYEKRSSTREAGLKGLISAFSARVMSDWVEHKYETLTHQFLACVKKCSSASEAALACRALGMLSISVGAGVISEHILGEAFSHLVKLAKAGSNPLARVSALEAMALLTFIGGVDDEATDDAMDVFWQISSHKGNTHADQTSGVSKPTPAVKAAAIGAWTFLFTTLSSSQIAARKLLLKVPVFSSLLEAQDLGVRKAAGEAVALVCESGDDGSFESVTQSTIIEQMKELAIGANRQSQGKKEQSEQRTSFRGLLAMIEEGVCRETSLKLQHGDSLKITTWAQTIQLNFFRKFLAEGFQRHMQENVLLHEVFEYTPRQNARSSKEKRKLSTTHSLMSKLRTQRIQRKRDEAFRNCNELGNDID